jgi:serine/threonine-protein kinase
MVLDVENDPLVGTKFACHYQIESIAGFGASSIVYKATHTKLARPFAVKVMHAHLLTDDQMRGRFDQEARACASLNDPNIVAVQESGITDEGRVYFAMEYLQGVTLEQILDSEGAQPIDRSVKIFKQICCGLAHAHGNGVLHRDLKPSNILIFNEDGKERAKILDFGLAKVLDNVKKGGPKLTLAGEVCGTPSVMSPEGCLGKTIDQRSDIYSLGCLMYETLSGLPPFIGDTTIATMTKHVMEKPPEFETIDADLRIPWSLTSIIFRCLEKDPDMRFQTIQEVHECLSQF